MWPTAGNTDKIYEKKKKDDEAQQRGLEAINTKSLTSLRTKW